MHSHGDDTYLGETSNFQDDVLMQNLASGKWYIEEIGRCPYCGDEVSIEPTSMCCGEVHGEMVSEVWEIGT